MASFQGIATSFYVLPSAQYFAERGLELLLATSIFLYRFTNLMTSYLLVKYQVSARKAFQLSAVFYILAGLSVVLMPNAVGLSCHQACIGISSAGEPGYDVASRRDKNSVLTGGIRNALRAVTLGLGFIAGSALMFREATYALLIIYMLIAAGTLLILSLGVQLEESQTQEIKKKNNLRTSLKEFPEKLKEFAKKLKEIPKKIKEIPKKHKEFPEKIKDFFGDSFNMLLGGVLLFAVAQNVGTHWTAAFSEKASWILGIAAILSAVFQGIGSVITNRWKSFNPLLILISRAALVIYSLLVGWSSGTTLGLAVLIIVWALVTMGPTFVKNVTSKETKQARLNHLANSLAGLLASAVMALVIWLGPLSVAVLGLISIWPLRRFWREHIPQ